MLLFSQLQQFWRLFSDKMNRKIREIVYIIRNFSFFEKISFCLLGIIFIASFFSFIWRVSSSFMVEIPSSGGSLTEGMTGTPRFVNPILAISDTDRNMSSIIYSGLLRPDNKGGLIPDLAEKYEISEDNLTYTFTLKKDLEWQDGEPLTADDVVFTIQQTRDPVIKSPKRANWEGVEVKKIDERTIEFTLTKPYAVFLENFTMGILPKHIWSNAVSEQMSFSDFNIQPIGSGTYKIDNVSRNSSGIITSYKLVPNENFSLGKPYINNLAVKFYLSEKEIINSYKKGDIDSIGAMTPQIAQEIKNSNSVIKTLFLPRTFGVFFNQNAAPLLSNKEVRQALDFAIDKTKIINEALAGFGTELNYPTPPGTFGAIQEEGHIFSIEKAKEILKKNGWEFDDGEKVWGKTTYSGNKKEKKEMKMEFSLSTSDAPDLKQTAELLKSMWEEMGAKVSVRIFETGDLNQNIIRPRKYDAILFGEIVGRDPDPFAFWHSSQRNDPGLNISMYANIKVDKLLEEARATVNDEKRKDKYEEFQKEVANDLPAIFLFSPKFVYLLPEDLRGLEKIESITVPSERFSQIYKWYFKTDKVWKIFAKQEN